MELDLPEIDQFDSQQDVGQHNTYSQQDVQGVEVFVVQTYGLAVIALLVTLAGRRRPSVDKCLFHIVIIYFRDVLLDLEYLVAQFRRSFEGFLHGKKWKPIVICCHLAMGSREIS